MAEWNKDALTSKLGDLKLYVIVINGPVDKLQKAAGGFMNEAEAQAVESKHDICIVSCWLPMKVFGAVQKVLWRHCAGDEQ